MRDAWAEAVAGVSNSSDFLHLHSNKNELLRRATAAGCGAVPSPGGHAAVPDARRRRCEPCRLNPSRPWLPTPHLLQIKAHDGSVGAMVEEEFRKIYGEDLAAVSLCLC